MKRLIFVLFVLAAACNQSPTSPAPVPLPPQYPAPKLGPSAGLYGRVSSHTNALTAAGGSASDSVPADTSWSPFTAGARLQVIQRLEVGADGSTFSAIAGFYDNTLSIQCTLMSIGEKRYCLPKDQVTKGMLPTELYSLNSDCSNAKPMIFMLSSQAAPRYFLDDRTGVDAMGNAISGESHLYEIEQTAYDIANTSPVYRGSENGACQAIQFSPGTVGFVVGTSSAETQFVEFSTVN